jgi:hypothetical protein
MRTIYKYPLRVADEQEVEIPKDAVVLTVQVQYGQPCLWAWVDTANPPGKRTILIRGTGHPADGLGRYISTFQMEQGKLVFHAFESL